MSQLPLYFTKEPDKPYPIDALLDFADQPGDAGVFVGQGGNYPILGVYGGHLVAQALAAAFRTVDEDRPATSIHVNFIKAPRAGELIYYHVETLRDGGRYSTRSIRASQDDEIVLMASATFKIAEEGDEHQEQAPRVKNAQTLVAREQEEGKDPFLVPITGHGVDIVQANGWQPLVVDQGEARIIQWVKAQMEQSDDPRHHQCVLAYLSDSTILFSSLRPHGNFMTHTTTSVDHTIWFYRPCDPRDWLLFESHSPVATGKRGFSNVTIFDGAGKLVATAAQESSIRRR